MPDVRTVKLELLRAGPPHNQLLSPLTPYIALCGSEGPVTVHLPFEHHQMLTRLQRLRYISDAGLISAEQRESEVLGLGAAIGDVFSAIPTLNAQLARARQADNAVIHLRLVVSGSELALLPFELVTAPEGFPGPGLPLLLQADTPITLTREVRRGVPPPMNWNQKPRLLFAVASPPNLPAVPVREHLLALRHALEPWVKWRPNAEERTADAKELLTFLPHASLESIRRACAETQYTHVHILAHGIPYERTGERRFGLGLCADADPAAMQTVGGEQLAQALRATDTQGQARSRPTLVSLASCDSGNLGSVVTPGGSIAHDLHAFGIPWVVASQFPLTMSGSVTVTEVLYTRLLRGDDPRLVLYELRQRLYESARQHHDWVSLVVYATVPGDFEKQLASFRDQQLRAKLDVTFGKAQTKVETNAPDEDVECVLKAIRHDLARWRDSLPKGESLRERVEQAECYGMIAASEKRVAGLHLRQSNRCTDSKRKAEFEEKAAATFKEARAWYRKAMEVESANHWVMTQYLSLGAVLQQDESESEAERDWWVVAHRTAMSQLHRSSTSDRAWAHGTLAELELLGTVYGNAEQRDPERAKERVVAHCTEIRELVGDDSFHVRSTRSQFQRYRDWWAAGHAGWLTIVEAALRALPPDGAATKRSSV